MSHWPEIIIIASLVAMAALSGWAWLNGAMADPDEIDEELDEDIGESDQPDGDFG